MKKKFIIALSLIATLVAGTITGCAAYESSSHPEVISDTSISSENEPTSSEDSSSEYIVDSSEDESSENDSSETDSSEDESSEVEKVTTKTPKKVEDSSSEDDNSSKETTTVKKTETPKTTTTAQPVVTQAPVTQKPATTTKTTTKKTTTHTHRWVKQWDDGNGTIFYWCPDCFAEKYDHYTVTTTTTKTQPTSKTIKSNEWIPVYFKTVVANCRDSSGYDKVTGKRVHWISPTYWDVKALSRGEAKALADYKKANDEALAWCYTVNAGAWVQGGNDHPINTPDKSSIAFWYYRDSNGKLAVQLPNGPNQLYSGIKTEADLKTYGCYDNVSLICQTSYGFGYNNVYYTGTPWAK